MPWLADVRGVGGAAEAAILLLDLVALLSEDTIASAAFLFLSWEEMVSVVGELMLNSSGGDEMLAHKVTSVRGCACACARVSM